jgi:hypothetical protein
VLVLGTPVLLLLLCSVQSAGATLRAVCENCIPRNKETLYNQAESSLNQITVLPMFDWKL